MKKKNNIGKTLGKKQNNIFTLFCFCGLDRTAVFGEYECSGKGSNRSERVEWSKALSREEAVNFLSRDYIYGDGWLRL